MRKRTTDREGERERAREKKIIILCDEILKFERRRKIERNGIPSYTVYKTETKDRETKREREREQEQERVRGKQAETV